MSDTKRTWSLEKILRLLTGALAPKADKVSNATSGNFAGLDSNGNLTDSGHKHSDYLGASLKGAASGVAELDSNGKVPSSQLPESTSEVLEYSSVSAFPETGESGVIYIATDTNVTYRWSGSAYVPIGSNLELGETSTTAYRGDRGKAAYDHASASGSQYASGFYKVETNAEGHVTGATPVAKADITALGIAPTDNPEFTGSVSIGRADNSTVGTNSTALGSGVEASGKNSHAEGAYTHATGIAAHAEGSNTIASGGSSHAEGSSTSKGSDSHAEGQGSVAYGTGSHAEGLGSKAYATGSHAEGNGSKASGSASHAEGWTEVYEGYGHAFGINNIPDLLLEGDGETYPVFERNHAYTLNSRIRHSGCLWKPKAAFTSEDRFEEADWDIFTGYDKTNFSEVVGGGNGSTPKNIRVLKKNGNEYIAGDLIFNCSSDPNCLTGTSLTSALSTQSSAVSGKADKDTDAVEGNFAAFDANGNPVDSGHKHSDYGPPMVVLTYGTSTWAEFLAAYQAHNIVYCQVNGRMAFMAYINFSGNTPTNVEFQYYRSVNAHSDSQQGDQMFVYKLTNAGEWTTTTRESYTKIVAGTLMSGTYSNGTLTLNSTLQSNAAASGGTDVSLVTTGEKYVWNNKIDGSEKGAASGVAELDSSGKVPSSQLPSYVDDVLEYASTGEFPLTGESGIIYIATDTNTTYRWGGSSYVPIGSSLALGETSSTAYRGDRGKAAYDHASAAGSSFASGMYKITTNAEGHVTAATAVVKSDLTALGVLDGNFGSANAGKFLVVGNDGSVELQTLEDATGVDFSGIQPASGNSF